tara:strand:+ start:418 stop:669 length:252 start_codon:yes stop_codon:yes gene_type:complete
LAERLTWVAARDPVDTRKFIDGKFLEISAPNRSFVQPPFLNRFAQDADAKGFPLDHAHRARSSANCPESGGKSEVETADSGAE